MTASTDTHSHPRLDFGPRPEPAASSGRWFWFVLMAGVYLTLRGYHAFDGDQAYRLPLLLHRQHPDLFATDPFVRAFDTFNPHRGYLALLDAASRPLGLAAGLAGLFALTLAATMLGVDRLARTVDPGQRRSVGLIAVGLLLLAKGGNIGTNHLFEGTLLDRLIAFALGWLAIAALIANPRRGFVVAAPALGIAAVIHPSVGLQLALTLGVALVAWAALARWGTEVTPAEAALACGALILALAPGLALVAGQGGQLLSGMPPDEFRHWAVEVQGPQHMLPATWRMPQWLAFGCYPALAGLAIVGCRHAGGRSASERRFGWLLVVNLASLIVAYAAVVWVQDLRVTVFQPFRMATLARGLCLVAMAGRLRTLWDEDGPLGRGRAIVLAVGLMGDWSLVVATAAELVAATLGANPWTRRSAPAGWLISLSLGLAFLARHDTEEGHQVLLLALGAWGAGELIARVRPLTWNRRRRIWVMVAAWAVPTLALGAGLGGERFVADHPWAEALVRRCRFAAVPVDDLERVARWALAQTAVESRFIGPPGEKEFRVWSERSLAFNRAGSPYHAAGLRDWSERFRDHVGFAGTTAEFARAYLAGRHKLEAGYERLTPTAKRDLARRQGADHILDRLGSAQAPAPDLPPGLTLATRLGRYAVYRVAPPPVTPEPPAAEPPPTEPR